MAQPASDALSAIFLDHRDEVLEDWIASQQSAVTLRHDLLSKAELRRESQDFLDAAAAAAQDGSIDDVDARGWERGRDYLASLSRSRAIGGFSPSETATFVLSLKRPVFDRLEALSGGDATALRESMWRATALIDRLALLTTSDAYLRSREEIINRQQQELLELSTPVVKLWEGVLAVPLIGTLDSARTQVVMENLLEMIVATERAARDHRHHGRPDGGHARRPAPAQDRRGGPAHGRRLHHQRHPAADRADDRAPGRRPGRRGDQGVPGRRGRASRSSAAGTRWSRPRPET